MSGRLTKSISQTLNSIINFKEPQGTNATNQHHDTILQVPQGVAIVKYSLKSTVYPKCITCKDLTACNESKYNYLHLRYLYRYDSCCR